MAPQSMERAKRICGGMASLTGKRVQSKLGDIVCCWTWLLNQLIFVTAGTAAVNGVASCTYAEGLVSPSIGVCWSAMPVLPSDAVGTSILRVEPSMLGTATLDTFEGTPK